jgi:hypothetical protein
MILSRRDGARRRGVRYIQAPIEKRRKYPL